MSPSPQVDIKGKKSRHLEASEGRSKKEKRERGKAATRQAPEVSHNCHQSASSWRHWGIFSPICHPSSSSVFPFSFLHSVLQHFIHYDNYSSGVIMCSSRPLGLFFFVALVTQHCRSAPPPPRSQEKTWQC